MSTEIQKITVFYDGGCGLCRREITHYIKIADDRFLWVDLSSAPHSFLALGYTLAEGLKALHVQNTSGQMHTGIEGFIVLWRNLPQPWPVLGLICNLPLIKQLAQFAYKRFANWRFRRLGYEAACRLK
jgi:predicted DCC family thiol-disulfide oxidoreductase YuxK